MIASTARAVVISSVETLGNLTILVVNLDGDMHYDMYRCFKNLPAVVVYNGQNFGKSCWNSDKGTAYYRNDMNIAIVK